MNNNSKPKGKYEELLERIAKLEAQIQSQQAGGLSDEQAEALDERIKALEATGTGDLKKGPKAAGAGVAHEMLHCAVPVTPPRVFSSEVSADRGRLIQVVSKKWVNGTKLRYAFMPDVSSVGGPAQKKLVREGFARWKDVGIGITFEEVPNITTADIRIGFVEGDGAWSYIGRDVRDIPGRRERTMNFGWDLTQDPRRSDVAVHEIGHTLGFPHEHQNPIAGIVWDEAEVLRVFGAPPNNWDEATIRHNILNKLPRNELEGSAWDPNSIMHYAFQRGLILQPAEFRNGLKPAGGLSPRDIAQAKIFYPSIEDSTNAELKPLRSQVLHLEPAGQSNLNILPSVSREYTFQTFGGADTVLVLFEDRGDGDLYYLKGDDDSGVERGASITARLFAGRRYVLRVRLFAKSDGNELAVMMS